LQIFCDAEPDQTGPKDCASAELIHANSFQNPVEKSAGFLLLGTNMNASIEEIRTLEECLLNAWPSTRTLHCDGWVLRQAGAYTKRANSASALAPSQNFPAVFTKARRFYAAQGQPTVFRLTPLADPKADALLKHLGFDCVDPTIVMSAPIVDCATVDSSVSLAFSYSEEWGAAYAAVRGLRPTEARAHAAILNPTAFATWRVDGEPLAFGLGVLDHDRLGLFDIATVASARRQGGANKIVTSLLGWGQSLGAHTAWLSVIAENAPAIALYEKLWFSEQYRYHYRSA
jgi:ribosomal protein S18 acetylase RimI-like enzyme